MAVAERRPGTGHGMGRRKKEDRSVHVTVREVKGDKMHNAGLLRSQRCKSLSRSSEALKRRSELISTLRNLFKRSSLINTIMNTSALEEIRIVPMHKQVPRVTGREKQSNKQLGMYMTTAANSRLCAARLVSSLGYKGPS